MQQDPEPPFLPDVEPTPPPRPPRHHAWHVPHWARWASTLGALGAWVLVIAPFLAWMHVQPQEAERFGRALAEAASSEPPGAGSEGFAALGRRLEAEHALTGLDLVQWAREARARLEDERTAGTADLAARQRLVRGWTLVSIVVLGMGASSLLLACYLIWHRLARFRPPLQVLAGMLSGVALTLAGGLTWLWRPFQGTVSPGPGHLALLLGGASLLVALVGTVRVVHLLGVLLATALALLALGALGWAYVAGATSP